MKIKWLVFSSVLLGILSGCSTVSKQSDLTETKSKEETNENVVMNDYPTRDRVEYVLNCVAQHGGLSYINQYACGCKIDKIAEKLTFEEYDSAKTFSYLKSTPGESGGVFRDPAQSKSLRARLKEAEAYAEKSCFVK